MITPAPIRRPLGRSMFILLALLAGLLGLDGSPASASSEQRVVVRSGLGPASSWSSSPCVGIPQALEHAFVPGPPGVPHGVGSMAVQDAPGSVVLEFPRTRLSGLDSFDLVSGTAVQVRFDAYLSVYLEDGSYAGLGVGRLELAAGWQSVDLADTEFEWSLTDTDGAVSMPLATLAGSRPDLQMEPSLMWATACEDIDLHLDAIRLGHDGSATLYDFEPPAGHVVVGAASTDVITAGESVDLDVWVVDDLGMPVADAPVAAFGRSPGAGSWDEVVGVMTSASGWTRTSVTPSRTREYRWQSEPAAGLLGGSSDPVLVRVRSSVDGAVRDATLRRRAVLVLTGSVRPLKPGHPVLLMRVTGDGARLLARSVVREDGTFRLSRRLTRKGSYRVFAQVPPGDGNLVGRSTVRRVAVR